MQLATSPAPSVAAATAQAELYLTFVLGGDAYAVRILAIKEIIEYGGVTPVPLMPPTIRGVINLRGAVVPVLDLSLRFGRQPTCTGRRSCIVIAETGEEDDRQVIGVIVDAVNAVQEIRAEEIEPAPAFGMKIASDFIQGIGKAAGRFVIVLDMDRVLSVTELAALAPESAPPALEAPP
jgi:purine-binding chemotaxis protein CheW